MSYSELNCLTWLNGCCSNESNGALHQWEIKVMLQCVVYMKGSITGSTCELPHSTILTAGKC